ncbi:hypothetical protein LEN26_001675 [Aphanomyces euteiches]|nr:hypothetical protein AeMF1_018631 [Aphanomyces euteiches]KAH9160893.1 hypothetical protein LEN26_001675 [Aphanomyces euteiches]KAH9194423.1 hypothetical protein AeNC1_003604 [Aphanomyces euteiches]
MSKEIAALTPLKSPIVFTNIAFKSDPKEIFSVELNDKTPEESPSLITLASTRFKLAWTARLDNLQGSCTESNALPLKSTVVNVCKKWLERQSSGQEQPSTDYQVDLRKSPGGSMCLLIAIKDSERGTVHGHP